VRSFEPLGAPLFAVKLEEVVGPHIDPPADAVVLGSMADAVEDWFAKLTGHRADRDRQIPRRAAPRRQCPDDRAHRGGYFRPTK